MEGRRSTWRIPGASSIGRRSPRSGIVTQRLLNSSRAAVVPAAVCHYLHPGVANEEAGRTGGTGARGFPSLARRFWSFTVSSGTFQARVGDCRGHRKAGL